LFVRRGRKKKGKRSATLKMEKKKKTPEKLLENTLPFLSSSSSAQIRSNSPALQYAGSFF